MSSLDVKAEDEPAQPKKEVDAKALADVEKYLSVGQDTTSKKSSEATKKKEAEAPKPLVKVDAADVGLLAEQLDMNRVKATELLRKYDADVGKALTGWVTSGAGA